MTADQSGSASATGFGAAGFDAALRDLGRAVAQRPEAAMAAWTRFATDCLQAGVATLSADPEAPAGRLRPDPSDRRFRDPAWQQNPLYAGLLQGYLLWSRLLRELVDGAAVEPGTRRKARFAVDQMIDAMAPTNTLLGNPAALRRALETGGASVAKGAAQFLEDLAENGGRPRQVDRSKFVVGRDLAATAGSVVFRNRLVELIQYAPKTRTVHQVPLLISPPWINKYYVMDLAPDKSFVQWAVEHGHTVFMLSYVNPGSEHRRVGFADYLREGFLAGLDVVSAITGAARVNAAGLCLGGTLAGIAAGYLAGGDDERLNSLTLMNTMLDFAEPGMLGAFVDEETIAQLEAAMAEKGYLEASAMSSTFDALRSNDLVWNYVVSGWLMGEEPPAFDLLAWNADATRMPATMHPQYLRECYLENRIARGTMKMMGRRIRLEASKADVYYVAAEEDHITPWRSCYASSRLFGGQVRFVLTSSGHIAGIVNPPGGRRTLRTNPDLPPDPEAWFAAGQVKQETWWEDWVGWIRAHAGRRVRPPSLGNADYPPLCDAPGTYVMAA